MKVLLKRINKHIPNSICLMSVDIIHSLGLKVGQKYNLNVGLLSSAVTFAADRKSSGQLTIGKSLFDNLRLIDNITLNIWKDNEKVYLGPVIGFLNSSYIGDMLQRGGTPDALQPYTDVNKTANCLFYSFGSNDINWNNRSVKGWVYDIEKRKWIKSWLPLPNVIYNLKDSEMVREGFARFKNVHFIYAQHRFDKWHTYERLSQIDEMKEYLPETIVYQSFEDIKGMLDRHGTVFLKAFYGSQGKQVLSVSLENNKYIVNYYDYDMKKINIIQFEDDASLKEMIEAFFASFSFVVQQGLKLSKFKGRKFDLRMLMQKDGTGQWQAVTYSARVAGEEIQITNTSSGGESNDYSTVYEYYNTLPTGNYLPTKAELKEIALKILGIIENEFGGYGEVGLDLGIDESGKVWFIEANRKPGKHVRPDIFGMENTINKYLNIFEYAKYLTGANKSED